MWRDASAAKVDRDPCLRSARSISRPTAPAERVRPARGAARRDRAGARPPLRRPAHDRRPGNGRARDPRGRSPGSTRSSSRAAAAGSSRGSPWRASRPACVWSRSSRRAPRRCARGSSAGEPVPVTPRSIADALDAPFAGELTVQLCARRSASRSCSSRRRRSAEAFRRSTRAPSSPSSRGAAAGLAAVLAGRVEGETDRRCRLRWQRQRPRSPLISWLGR